ncbi:MAG TPA: hypothetical protein VE998_07415, partial [Terriglobales bacterium]|nr:hypothetical protein [Terriglobales bacterium]
LRVYSEAPGIYAVYDYAEPLEHNGHILPRNISVTEAGQNVLDVRLESIVDPTPADLAQLQPGPELATAGAGNALSFPIRFQQLAPAPAAYKGDVHPVIIHAILDGEGRTLDQEPLQTSDPVLTQAAMDLVRTRTFPPPMGNGGNQRIVRAQREVFINVKFMVPLQTAAGVAPKP